MLGFAFVIMKKQAAAERAVKDSVGLKINGREVAVDLAVQKSKWEELRENNQDDDEDEDVDDQDEDVEEEKESDEMMEEGFDEKEHKENGDLAEDSDINEDEDEDSESENESDSEDNFDTLNELKEAPEAAEAPRKRKINKRHFLFLLETYRMILHLML